VIILLFQEEVMGNEAGASEDLRYPVGKWEIPSGDLTAGQRSALIDQIAETPERLRRAVENLTEEQLATPYRAGGWTVCQVVHHVPDSHLNSYVRFKLALTEDEPTIKTYHEDLWAELADSSETPISVSLELLGSLHHRWVVLLRSISASDWSRKLKHPEVGTITLDQLLSLYGWHGRHHVAHVTSLRQRMGWN
jgi:uncharacterized damage-inducible protein DinB